jgi:phospholipase D1/2
MNSIFQVGKNCHKVTLCDRAALLIDGEAYFKVFMQTAERAYHSIFILAWDFDTRMCLTPHKSKSAPPTLLGDFLNFLIHRRRDLNIYVLNWDYPMIFGTDREFPPIYGLSWKPRRRIHLRYDNTHPVGASHHQKIVVIDNAVAFSGGLDLTSRRWDTCEHKAGDPRRRANGNLYPPFHDLMAMVDGEAAQALGSIARERWWRATGEVIVPVNAKEDPWPNDVKTTFTKIAVGISRTMPPLHNLSEVREIEALYLDMIATARRYIYLENQYFTAHKLSRALASRLEEKDGPEIIVVLRLLSHGWLEEITMHTLRARLINQLRAADRWKRFGVYYPYVDGLMEGTCVDVHSKAMIVDDEWLRIGSANICNRSMGTDSECDLTFEARGKPIVNAAIRGFRDRLLGEHLDVLPEEVAKQYEITGSFIQSVARLQKQGRTLKPLADLPDAPEIVMNVASVADPEKPISMDNLIVEFAPVMPTLRTGPAWATLALVATTIAGLMAIWRFTPLSDVVIPLHVVELAHEIGSLWWAPLVVLAAYTPACMIMFPRPLITLFAVIAFGPWQGALYGLFGLLIAATIIFVLGRMMKRSTVRRIAGSRLNRVTELLRKKGLVAITALRIVPLAPFAVISLIAGAIRIKAWHYALGSFIGFIPGTITTVVLGDQLEAVIRDPSRVNYWTLAAVVAILIIGILIVRQFVFGGAILKNRQ